MQNLRIPIRVVFYRDNGSWIAHCLEFDLLGDGETREEALQKLATVIRLQAEVSLEDNNPANLFSPADGEYFRKFAAGRDIATGELKLHLEPIDNIRIEQVELREFAETAAAVRIPGSDYRGVPVAYSHQENLRDPYA